MGSGNPGNATSKRVADQLDRMGCVTFAMFVRQVRKRRWWRHG